MEPERKFTKLVPLRKTHGGARANAGRKKGFKNKVPTLRARYNRLSFNYMIVELRKDYRKAHAKLMEWINSKDPEVSITALELYFNRGYGKPIEQVKLDVADVANPAMVEAAVTGIEIAKKLVEDGAPFAHMINRRMKMVEQTNPPPDLENDESSASRGD